MSSIGFARTHQTESHTLRHATNFQNGDIMILELLTFGAYLTVCQFVAIVAADWWRERQARHHTITALRKFHALLMASEVKPEPPAEVQS